MQSNISRQRFLGTILTSFGYIKEANFLLSQRGKQIVANANIEPCHWQLEDATSNASSYSTTHISRHQQMQPVTNRHVLSKCMIIWTSSITITAYCSSKSFWYSAQNSKQNTQIFNYQTTEEPMISLIQKTFLNASFCWLPQPKISNIIKYSFNI